MCIEKSANQSVKTIHTITLLFSNSNAKQFVKLICDINTLKGAQFKSVVATVQVVMLYQLTLNFLNLIKTLTNFANLFVSFKCVLFSKRYLRQ